MSRRFFASFMSDSTPTPNNEAPPPSGTNVDGANPRRTVSDAVVQGAWALALSHHTGRPDVCFGATVSGRPALIAATNT